MFLIVLKQWFVHCIPFFGVVMLFSYTQPLNSDVGFLPACEYNRLKLPRFATNITFSGAARSQSRRGHRGYVDRLQRPVFVKWFYSRLICFCCGFVHLLVLYWLYQNIKSIIIVRVEFETKNGFWITCGHYLILHIQMTDGKCIRYFKIVLYD